MITTTLNEIKKVSLTNEEVVKIIACLGEEPIPLTTILEVSGLDFTLRCLKAVRGADKEMRLFAVDCARQVQHLITDQRSLDLLDVAERFANGEASWDDLAIANSAPGEVVCEMVWDATRPDAWLAAVTAAKSAAWYAACDATKDITCNTTYDETWKATRNAIRAKQEELFIKHFG